MFKHFASLSLIFVATAQTISSSRTISSTLLTSVLPDPTPTPELQARCDSRPCGGDGGRETLTPSTITITIVSTTSVPCYITTFVTNSVTTTSTVYTTQYETLTATKVGTVTVIEHTPTPVLRTSVLETVLSITQTYTSYWLETTGAAYTETHTGDFSTIAGPQPSEQWATGGGTMSAWTHASANAMAATGIPVNVPVWDSAASAYDVSIALMAACMIPSVILCSFVIVQ